MKKEIVATLLVLLFAIPVDAADAPAERSDFFMKLCDSPNTPPRECYAYLRGASDGMRYAMEMIAGLTDEVGPIEIDRTDLDKAMKASAECLDPRITSTQTIAIWVKYLRNHPEQHHLPGVVTYHAAMEDAFPCE